MPQVAHELFAVGSRDAPVEAPMAAVSEARAEHAIPDWRVVVVLGDLAMLLLAVALAQPPGGSSTVGLLEAVSFVPLACAALAVRGTYRDRLTCSIADWLWPVAGSLSLTAMALIAIVAIGGSGHSEVVPVLAYQWLMALILVVASRTLLELLKGRLRRQVLGPTPALILGAGDVGERIARRLGSQPSSGLRPVGFLDANVGGAVGDLPVLGSPADLERVVAQHGIRHVLLAYSERGDDFLAPAVRRAADLGLRISMVPRLSETVSARGGHDRLGGLPLVHVQVTDPRGPQFAVKHAVDRVVAAWMVLAVAPVLLAIAAAVRLSSPGPVLFRQRRVGRDGQPFEMLKFRTMRLGLGPAPDTLPQLRPGCAGGGVEGVDRRTAIGKILRRTALDELPQLLNVLRGEMSLVGPRPERVELVRIFDHEVRSYVDRHRVKAGMTGWAQIHGLRGQTSLSDRVELDNYYIRNWSLWLDLKILGMTLLAVIRDPAD